MKIQKSKQLEMLLDELSKRTDTTSGDDLSFNEKFDSFIENHKKEYEKNRKSITKKIKTMNALQKCALPLAAVGISIALYGTAQSSIGIGIAGIVIANSAAPALLSFNKVNDLEKKLNKITTDNKALNSEDGNYDSSKIRIFLNHISKNEKLKGDDHYNNFVKNTVNENSELKDLMLRYDTNFSKEYYKIKELEKLKQDTDEPEFIVTKQKYTNSSLKIK